MKHIGHGSANGITGYTNSQDGQKRAKESGILDENEGADGLACHSNLIKRVVIGRGCEKFVAVAQEHRKRNDIADNHVEEKKLACSKLGVDGVACNTDLEERICLAGAEDKEVVVESHKPRRKRRQKQKHTKGNVVPVNLVGGVGRDSNRILKYHVAEDRQKQTEETGNPAYHVGEVGLNCHADVKSLVGSEGEKVEVESQKPRRKCKRRKGNGIPENCVGGDGVGGNRIWEYHVAEDGQKQTEGSGCSAYRVGADGLACNRNLKILVDTEGEKVEVESQKSRRKKKRRKGNCIPKNLVGGDGVDGTTIWESLVAEDGQKQTEGSRITADNVGADGLACNRNLQSLVGPEGEKAEDESRKSRRKRKLGKGNGIPQNLVGGIGLGVDGDRILEYHEAEDGPKQTSGSAIPANHVAADGLTCNTSLQSLAGTECEKAEIESRKPRRKWKRGKRNGIPQDFVGGAGLGLVGNRILEYHVAENGLKQTEGSTIPADHVGTIGLACNTNLQNLAGTEGEKVEGKSRKSRRKWKCGKGTGIPQNLDHEAEERPKQTEGSATPADLGTPFDSLVSAEVEKAEVESRKPRRKRKYRKGNGIPENIAGGYGEDGNMMLEYRVAEDGPKQKGVACQMTM